MRQRQTISIAFLPALLACTLLAVSCQKPLEYGKYENDGAVPRIAVEDAKKDFDSGNAVIVDSRPEAAYLQEHVTGSINVPAGSSDTEFSKIPQGKKIIVYCS